MRKWDLKPSSNLSDGRVLVFNCCAKPSTFPLCPKQPEFLHTRPRHCQSPRPWPVLSAICSPFHMPGRGIDLESREVSPWESELCHPWLLGSEHLLSSSSLALPFPLQVIHCVSGVSAPGRQQTSPQNIIRGRGRARWKRSILFSQKDSGSHFEWA